MSCVDACPAQMTSSGFDVRYSANANRFQEKKLRWVQTQPVWPLFCESRGLRTSADGGGVVVEGGSGARGLTIC